MAGSNEELRARLRIIATDYQPGSILRKTIEDAITALAPAQEPAGGGEALKLGIWNDYAKELGYTSLEEAMASTPPHRLATPTPQAAVVSGFRFTPFRALGYPQITISCPSGNVVTVGDRGKLENRVLFEIASALTAAVAAPEGLVDRIVSEITADPFNATDTETLRRCVTAAIAAPQPGAQEVV